MLSIVALSDSYSVHCHRETAGHSGRGTVFTCSLYRDNVTRWSEEARSHQWELSTGKFLSLVKMTP